MPVRYFVRDVGVAVTWYQENLGFELVEKWGPAFAIMAHSGGTALWLSGPGTSAMKPMPDGRVPEPGGWNRFVHVTDDIQGLVGSLRSAGVAFRGEIITGPGGSQALIEDADGNPIELFQTAD